MERNTSRETLPASMFWIMGLSAVAVGVPLAITLTLLLSSAAVEWLIRAFALRGSLLVFFGVGGLIILCAIVILRIKSYVHTLHFVSDHSLDTHRKRTL